MLGWFVAKRGSKHLVSENFSGEKIIDCLEVTGKRIRLKGVMEERVCLPQEGLCGQINFRKKSGGLS